MKHAEAEQLLGGYATGTLSEAERKALFAAALDHQDLFDALMDEECLRDLLADPAAKAQLLAALAPQTRPKVVPFWRRTGVLGAAAGLLVAATAGLAYLRSPDKAPPSLRQEAPKGPAPEAAPAAQAQPAPSGVVASPLKETSTVAPPAPARPRPAAPAGAASVAIEERGPEVRDSAELRRAEAQDRLAKKAEAPRPAAAALLDAVPAQQANGPERRTEARDRSAGGVVGGLAGGVAAGTAREPGPGATGARPSPPAATKAKAAGQEAVASTAAPPRWSLKPRPDGGTQVDVLAARGAQVYVLRRGPAGVAVLKLQAQESERDGWLLWRGEVRLAPEEALDLYLLDHAVVDPSRLPEAGPVDGFRVRIHPSAKKDPMP